MCDIVWISPQSHSSLSVNPHFLWHALQWPWPVWKRFSSDHWRLWTSKPGSRIVGSTTKVELTTIADCQSSLHRLVTSIDCMSIYSGLRDSRRSGGGWKTSYNGQSRWHSTCIINLSANYELGAQEQFLARCPSRSCLNDCNSHQNSNPGLPSNILHHLNQWSHSEFLTNWQTEENRKIQKYASEQTHKSDNSSVYKKVSYCKQIASQHSCSTVKNLPHI